MATNMTILVNAVDPDVDYQTTPADYIEMDLQQDYLIWSEGDAVVKDLMTTTPSADELNNASTQIDPLNDVTVNLCLLYDYSHDWGGSYYTHQVLGMGENKRYVYAFSFDGTTASEPRLEAWDNDSHNSTNNHVLGNGTPANSFVKAVCTTSILPGAGWSGSALAGANYLNLNDGSGALGTVPSGQTTQELYANLKIVIPAGYSTPGAEVFVLTCRYTWS